MATVDILHAGYVRSEPDGQHVGSSVTLVRSGDLVAVVDPGMVSSRATLLEQLAAAGVRPDEVTDVVLSHHHPDHTVNTALFPDADVHDHWAVYRGDVWDSQPAEGRQLADDVVLWETPGHTAQDVSTVVTTDTGVVVCTHLWWDAAAEGDPRATDLDALHRNRERVLEVATRVVPGHGPAFDVSPSTPR